MFPQEDCVQGSQRRLFACPSVTPFEAEPGSGLALEVLMCFGQQVLAPSVMRQGDVETTVRTLPKVVSVALVTPIYLRRVDIGCVLVQLLTRTYKTGEVTFEPSK